MWDLGFCQVGNAISSAVSAASRAVVDVVAIVPYAIYAGSYEAASGLNSLGCYLHACWAGKIAALSFVPSEAAGLGADLAIDGYKTWTGMSPGEGFADESTGPSDTRSWNPLHSWLPGGPQTYLPGVSRRHGCIHVDFAW